MLKLKKRCRKCNMLKTFKSFDEDSHICKRCIINSYKENKHKPIEYRDDNKELYYLLSFTLGFIIGLIIRSMFI